MSPADDALLSQAFALLQRYVQGDTPLADVVAAIRALPPATSGDVAFGLDGATLPAEAEARLVALGEALASRPA